MLIVVSTDHNPTLAQKIMLPGSFSLKRTLIELSLRCSNLDHINQNYDNSLRILFKFRMHKIRVCSFLKITFLGIAIIWYAGNP